MQRKNRKQKFPVQIYPTGTGLHQLKQIIASKQLKGCFEFLPEGWFETLALMLGFWITSVIASQLISLYRQIHHDLLDTRGWMYTPVIKASFKNKLMRKSFNVDEELYKKI